MIEAADLREMERQAALSLLARREAGMPWAEIARSCQRDFRAWQRRMVMEEAPPRKRAALLRVLRGSKHVPTDLTQAGLKRLVAAWCREIPREEILERAIEHVRATAAGAIRHFERELAAARSRKDAGEP